MSLNTFDNPKPFKAWCYKVLPLVYDDSLSYYELLCKVVDSLNKTIANVEILENGYITLKNYVDNYFDNLNVQNEIDNKLDEMALDGTLSSIIMNYVNLTGRKFLCVGDSYAIQSENWVTFLKNFLGLQSTQIENLAVSGTAFYNGSFLSQIENYSGDKDVITDIIVGGGLNDSIGTNSSGISTVMSGIANFATYAKTNYPNARLWLAFMGNALDNSAVLYDRDIDHRLWGKFAYETAGQSNGFIIIQGCELALATSTLNFNDDGLHPSSSGSASIARVIANNIRGCGRDSNYPIYPASLTPVGNNAFYEAVTAKYTIEENMLTFESTTIIETIGTDYATLDYGEDVDLFTFTGLYFNKEYRETINVLISNYGTLTYQSYPATLKFNGNKCSLFIGAIKDDGSGYKQQSADSDTGAITFADGFKINVPLYYVN